MFVCTTCYRETEDPNYVTASLFQPFRFGFRRRAPYPVCACGRPLCNWVVGNFSELPAVLASLRGLGVSLVGLVLAAGADARLMREGSRNLMTLPFVIAGFASMGMVALWMGYLWSSQRGPTVKLVPRAFGTATGFLLPSGLLAAAFLLGGLRDLSFLNRLLERVFS